MLGCAKCLKRRATANAAARLIGVPTTGSLPTYCSGPPITTSSGALNGVQTTAGIPSAASSMTFVPGIVTARRAVDAARIAARTSGKRWPSATISPPASSAGAPYESGWSPPRASAARSTSSVTNGEPANAIATPGSMRRRLSATRTKSGKTFATSCLREPGKSTIPSRAASLGGSPYTPAASPSAPSMARFPTMRMRSSGVPHPSSCSRFAASTANTQANVAAYFLRENLYDVATPPSRA